MMTKYDKLVRDNIPEIIALSGRMCYSMVAKEEDVESYIIAKIREELSEFEEAHSLEELADLYEAVEALREFKGFSIAELEAMRKQKGAEKGYFKRRRILLGVEE